MGITSSAVYPIYTRPVKRVSAFRQVLSVDICSVSHYGGRKTEHDTENLISPYMFENQVILQQDKVPAGGNRLQKSRRR
jgi:hypothetical protein